jgi:hypothetical protein
MISIQGLSSLLSLKVVFQSGKFPCFVKQVGRNFGVYNLSFVWLRVLHFFYIMQYNNARKVGFFFKLSSIAFINNSGSCLLH